MKFRHIKSGRIYTMMKQYGSYTHLLHNTEKRRIDDITLRENFEIVSDDEKELNSVDLFFEIMHEIKGRPLPEQPKRKKYCIYIGKVNE